MKTPPLVLSCIAFLLSAFSLHVAVRTRNDIQAFVHSLPPGGRTR